MLGSIAYVDVDLVLLVGIHLGQRRGAVSLLASLRPCLSRDDHTSIVVFLTKNWEGVSWASLAGAVLLCIDG